MGCEAKHIAIIKDGGAFHGHIGGHVLQGGGAAAGPPVVAHGVAVVVAAAQLRQSAELREAEWRL